MTNSLRQVLPQANVALMYNFKRRPIAPAKMPRTATQPLLHLAYLGRLREEKGIFFLIAAAKLLMQSKVGINLHFYGDFLSRDKEVEMRFYESIKSADFIEYKGYLAAEEIQATLGNYDMLVFPTYYPGEGFPGVLIDAAFAGIPVVATDFAYNAELVIDGVTGVLCSPRNADSLAKAIASFYDNQRCLAMLGENAWSRSERFDSALAVVRLLRVFRLSPNEEER